MTVSALNALAPMSRPSPERSSRTQEERDFSRALDEAEGREEPHEAEEAETEEAAATEAVETDAAPVTPDAFATPVSLPVPVEAPALPAAAASLLAASLPAPESDVGAAPAEPIAAAQAGPQVEAPEAQSAAAAVVPGAAAGSGAGAESPQEAEGEPKARPLAERVEGDAEVDPAVWTPPGAAKQAAGKAVAASIAGDAQPAAPEGDALAPVKVLRHAGSETPPLEARPAAASSPAPQPAAPPPGAAATPFEAHLKAADGGDVGAAQQAAAPRPAAQAAPAAQVAIHIARAFEDGVRRLEVRLNPAELGKVEVKLDVASDGRVIAVVSAERQETLDLLQRDARNLERGLQDAGIRADSGSLNFTLRQQDRQAWSGGGLERRFGGADQDVAPQAAAAAAFRPRAALRALDISV